LCREFNEARRGTLNKKREAEEEAEKWGLFCERGREGGEKEEEGPKLDGRRESRIGPKVQFQWGLSSPFYMTWNEMNGEEGRDEYNLYVCSYPRHFPGWYT
jgi:hypothetical protein